MGGVKQGYQGTDVERRIVTGLIVSDEYVRKVKRFWRDDLLESSELGRIARWALDHFDRYGRVADRDIGQVFFERVQSEQLPKAEAEEIERILGHVSNEYGRGDKFNVAYLYDRTVRHFRQREIDRHLDEVMDAKDRGDLDKVQQALRSFRPQSFEASRGLDVGSPDGLDAVEKAFGAQLAPIITYPDPLGKLINPILTRDAFVALMGIEKRGKTFWLLDLAVTGVRHHLNVAFFQAGDLTEPQLLRRLAVHLAGKSDMEEYCQPYWRPVGDCVMNQFDRCDRRDRDAIWHPDRPHGIHEGTIDEFWTRRDEFECTSTLVEKAEEHPGYRPCAARSCLARKPTVWLERKDERHPLSGTKARTHVERFFKRHRRRFKLATYPSGTLTTEEISSCLDEWESEDDFVPDLICVDYADIMTAPEEREYRHRQDAIWRGLRRISQERHALVVSATQADAAAQKQNRIGASNFSEDKRKLAHVTGMVGLNQSPDGREKALGLMRLGMIVARESAFSSDNEVVVLQDLRSGRPFTGSYKR